MNKTKLPESPLGNRDMVSVADAKKIIQEESEKLHLFWTVITPGGMSN